MSFENDFIRGQRDCEAGWPPRVGQSEAYYRGYSTQYEKEQVQAEMTKNGN